MPVLMLRGALRSGLRTRIAFAVRGEYRGNRKNAWNTVDGVFAFLAQRLGRSAAIGRNLDSETHMIVTQREALDQPCRHDILSADRIAYLLQRAFYFVFCRP